MNKRLIALLLAVIMIFSCLAGCGSAEKNVSSSAPDPEAEETFELPPIEDERTGWEVYDRVYKMYDPDTVVMHINGVEVTWDQYYYRLFQIVNQFAYYLGSWDWKDMLDDEHDLETYTKENIEQAIAQYASIIKHAADEKVTISDESLAEVNEVYEQNFQQMGEGDEEKFAEALKEFYLTPERYRWMLETSALYSDLFKHHYGVEGSNLSDEEVMDVVNDMEYMYCMHILLTTIDTATREALPEDEVAQKLATTKDILAQLQAVQDDPEQLKEKFVELMNEYTEDPGVATAPNGYYFQPGEMVAEFENATKALDDYGLSDIVESSYGYHIIMRLPITPDSLVDGINSMRMLAATELFTRTTNEWFTDYEVEYEPEFAALDYSTLFAQN